MNHIITRETRLAEWVPDMCVVRTALCLIFQIRGNDESGNGPMNKPIKKNTFTRKNTFRYQVLGVRGQESKRVKEPSMHVYRACKLSKHHQSREWNKAGTNGCHKHQLWQIFR